MSEEWKPVVGYEGYYEVSSLGRVRSLPRDYDMPSYVGNIYSYHHKGRVLKQTPNKSGYFTVCLCRKTVAVHRLVAMAFVPNPNNLQCVNHKDENPKNNHADNLEWCTVRYNLCYGTRLARVAQKAWVPVIGTDKDGNEHYFPSMREAGEKTGIDCTCISACCRGMKYRHTAGGYKWRYA